MNYTFHEFVQKTKKNRLFFFLQNLAQIKHVGADLQRTNNRKLRTSGAKIVRLNVMAFGLLAELKPL
jgi:hypothetical protein